MRRACRPLLAAAVLAAAAAAAAHAHGGPAAVAVVACPTNEPTLGQNGPIDHLVRPAGLPATAPAPAGARGLVWYASDLGRQPVAEVLAPRGWHCTAVLYADDGFKLIVAPPGPRPDRLVALTEESSAGAEIACTVLPGLAPLAPFPGRCTTPARARIARIDAHLTTVVLPADGGRVRLLARRTVHTAFPDRGLVYWYRALSWLGAGVDCVLPGRAPCATILDEAKARLGADLARQLAAQQHVPPRPLVLPRLGPGEACPVSPHIDTPDYELLADGPVRLTTIGGWIDIALSPRDARGYFAAKAAWGIAQSYRGPIVISGRRLDRPGPVLFWNNFGDHTRAARWADDDRPANPGQGFYWLPAAVYVKHVGCYGFQIDGTTFSAHVVVRVVRH